MIAGFACNVSKNIKLDLSNLAEEDKSNLIKFISRVSEVSYRRGFQQGVTLVNKLTCDPAELRYKRDIDDAPWGESSTSSGRNAIDILKIEYENSFKDIGLNL